MPTTVVVDGQRVPASGSVIRQYRKMRGLTQEELGRRLNVRKSRISKIENDDNLDIQVLIDTLRQLDVEAEILVSAANHVEMEEVYTFIISCVDEFARRKDLTRKAAFNYLNLYKAIKLLTSCYEAEITLPLDEIINDMTLVCKRNGGHVE